MSEFSLLINGRLTSGATTLDVINPATEQVLAAAPRANRIQLDEAVVAAKAAFPAWSATPLSARGALLVQLASALEARQDEFARLLTEEQGKALLHAKREIIGSIGIIRYFSSLDLSLTVLREDDKRKVVQQRTPLGVVVTITPWSFPMLLLMMKVAPALLAGNTVVAKPAPTTPLTTLRFGELCADVFPAGVVNVIVDQNDLGDALRGHPDVAKVSFTGSTLTSKKFMASVAGTLKRMTLELGSNDAAIVLDDSDLETVAPKVLAGAMMNSGQVCRAIKRLYVHESQYDEMRDALGQMAREIVVDDARHAQEGPFDPVLPVLRYSDIDDVIARANNTLYGRGGSIWSSDPERAFDVAAKTDSGAVWFDQPMGLPADIASAGANQSGSGQQMDQEGLEEFTQMKVTNMAK